MQNNSSYLLGTNTQAAKNLDTQHELMGPTAFNQLEKAGLKTGMVVWDIGCGSGAMTEYLAECVGAEGHVYGLDVSQDQLNRTQRRLEKKGFQNVTFIQGDITSNLRLPEQEADLVYGRMILMHLKNVEVALKQMIQLLKPSGMLSLQESTLSTINVTPAHKIVFDYFETLIALGKSRGVDFNIGRKLPLLCQQYGALEEVIAYTSQHELNAETTKEKLLSRLEEWEANALQAQLITEEELCFWKKELEELPKNYPSFSFYTAEQTHVLAKKGH